MNENKNLTPEPEEEILSIFDVPEEEELTPEPLPEESEPTADALAEEPAEEAAELFEPAPEPAAPWVYPEAEAAEPEAEIVSIFDAPEEPEWNPDSLPEEPAEEVTEEELFEEVSESVAALLEDETPADPLEDPLIGEEIGVDETAVIGLARHGDQVLDQILQENHRQETQVVPMPDMTPLVHEPEEEKEEESVRKRRPKMKKGYGLLGIPHIVVTAVWLAIIALVGITLGRTLWLGVSEILAFGKPDNSVVVTISDGDNIDTVTAKLKAAGLVRYPELFKKYAELTKADEDISAGTFTLNTKYDYFALVKAMSYHSPARETVEVVIPEGYTCAQIFALLEEKGVCTAEELEDYSANGEIKERWFLEGMEQTGKYCLEGYLFPDTYEFYTNDEPGRVLGKFLDGFDNRFTDIMKARIETLNERMSAILRERGYEEAVIEERKFTIRDIITIASMIEKETANDAESYEISSVIYNRLTNPANYPYLNIDATLIYALGGNIDPETGKTKPLTQEDLQMEHPYNTYTTKGLIPGPISNPGRNSLNAALDPTETSFYFYVYNPQTYVHLFAKTAKEHEKNVNYVRSLEED